MTEGWPSRADRSSPGSHPGKGTASEGSTAGDGLELEVNGGVVAHSAAAAADSKECSKMRRSDSRGNMPPGTEAALRQLAAILWEIARAAGRSPESAAHHPQPESAEKWVNRRGGNPHERR